MYCKYEREGDSVECLDNYYNVLDNNNEYEWVWALQKWWWNQLRIAWYWWLFIPMAAIMGVVQLLVPNLKPDVDNAPWRDNERPISTWFYINYSYVSQISEPNFFFLTQILTMGDSDLRDFSIIYMTNFEAFIYSFFNVLDMTLSIPFSLFFTTLFGWIYFG